jgi:glycosyltransferase involved in cell wall biosynthesis
MRILQVIWSLRRGGAERVCIDLSQGLQKRGHKVAIAILADVNEWEDIFSEDSIEVISVSPGRFPRWRTEFLSVAECLSQVFNTLAPDIVHTHCLSSTVAAWLSGWPPHIVTLHGTRSEPIGDKTGLSAMLNRFFFKRSIKQNPAYIVTPDSESIPRIQKILGVEANRIRTIQNGIDVEMGGKAREKEKQLSSPELNIGMVGSLIPVKNHEFAILGLRAMHDKGVIAALHICGEGKLRSSLERLAYELNLKQFVTFRGMCNDISSFLSSVDVFWMTSYYEGHSIALLEAMASGIPSVVTNVPGLRSFANYRGFSIIVPLEDSEALAAATLNLWKSKGIYREVSLRASSAAVKEFSIDRMVREYENVYRLL